MESTTVEDWAQYGAGALVGRVKFIASKASRRSSRSSSVMWAIHFSVEYSRMQDSCVKMGSETQAVKCYGEEALGHLIIDGQWHFRGSCEYSNISHLIWVSIDTIGNFFSVSYLHTLKQIDG